LDIVNASVSCILAGAGFADGTLPFWGGVPVDFGTGGFSMVCLHGGLNEKK
jgi:hypothetical protein